MIGAVVAILRGLMLMLKACKCCAEELDAPETAESRMEKGVEKGVDYSPEIPEKKLIFPPDQ